MALKYGFTDKSDDYFERIIQVENNDYIFKIQRIKMDENTDEKFDFWNCKIEDNNGNILSNKPITYNSKIFLYKKTQKLDGNFVFITKDTNKTFASGDDFKNDETSLIYYTSEDVK